MRFSTKNGNLKISLFIQIKNIALLIMFKRFLDRIDFPYFNYISEDGLKNLSKYKYNGMDHSFIANNFLQPYWTWLACKLPDWPA